jgi:hypothetical protein
MRLRSTRLPVAAVSFVIIYALLLGLNPLMFAGSSFASEKSSADVAPQTSSAATQDVVQGPTSSDVQEAVTAMVPGAEESRKKELAEAASVDAAKAAEPSSEKIEGSERIEDIGPNNTANYGFVTTTTASFTDMSTGTTQLLGANIDDTASALTNIGFDFYFQGARFTQFSINDNGVLRLGATAQTSTPYKPLAQAGISIITAYGADQRTHAGDGKVHFKVTGSAPNRVLIVEWLNQQSNFNTGGTADLTYQVRLNESTGTIEFVYGSMTMSTLGAADTNSRDPHIGFSSTNTAGNVGSVTAAQGGAPAPTFNGASNDPVENLYTAGAITVLTSVADGSRRSFSYSPPVPTAPTGLNFTGVTQLAMTLNWTDSPDELIYAIYRSTDGTNFSFDGTAAQNATSYPATGLAPGTTYFWRVFAVSEGALSTALAGSQATGAAGNISSTGAGGNWSDTATWVGGVVPGAGDNATIVTGATVTIDSSNCLNLTVQTGATLQYEATTARTLTVGQNVTIDSGGVFQSATTGTQTGHVLSIGGNLTNNGTIDFSTNGNTAGAGITFTGASAASVTFGGGSTTDFKQTAGLTVNKGTNNTPVLSFNPGGTITVLGANAVGFLTITNGTFKMDGSGAFSNPLFNVAAYSIPATGGLWMNNANANVVGLNGSPTLTGLFRMTSGTFNVGTASGNSMGFAAGANINVEGGAINTTGRFGVAASSNAITYNQTAGTITVCTVGNASTTLGSFDLGTGVGTTNISGGNIIIQLAATGASGPRDYRNQSGLTGTTTVTGGTVQFGNAASGAAKAYSAAGVFPNLVIDNTSAGHSLTLLAPAVFNNITRNITINPGTTFNIGNNVFLMNGTTLTNNGTLTANGASSNFVWFLTTAPQTYAGAGVVTAPITNFAIQADMGLTIDPAVSNIVVNAIRLFSGSVVNSNKITLGNGGATTGVVQIGNTTTPTACGTFDAAFIFNLGTGGQTVSYLRCTLSRSTGPEINPTRTLTTFTRDDNDVTHTLTLAGGDLTTTGTTALTNGRVVTGANTQIVGPAGTVTRTTGLVDGNLRKTYTAAASKSFEVGTANGFSPVTVNVTAGTFPGDFTVKAVQGQMPQVSGTNALQRYWTLTNNITGATADLTFNYLVTDVVGTAASYVFFKSTAGSVVQVAPAAAPTTTQATVNGVSAFSDWTLAETGAFMPGSFAFSSATYTDSETNADHSFSAVVNRVGGSDGNVSVDYQVTDGSATVVDNDYTIGSPTGTLIWLSGDATPKNVTITVKVDTTVEPDETVNFAILNQQGGAVVGAPNSSVLTITNDDAAGTPAAEGELIISEFRLRGPNPNGAQNEFIEIYNASGAAHTVSALSGTGYGVAASDGVTRCTIPNGTVIPDRGHYLCVNSVGYALADYGGTGAAAGDATYTTDIPDNAGIALFNNNTGGGSYTLANRLDAVGSTSEANTLYKEGTGYPALTPFSIDYAFVRDNCGKQGSITTLGGCPSGGLPVDNDNNAVDFYFVDTNGTSAGAGQRLGAPGPENLASPIMRNSSFSVVFLDATVAGSAPPNRVRDFTSDPANNSTFGTLEFRRRVVNNTGAPVTKLRYRVMDITTFPAPSGYADLRTRTSTLVVVSGINDAATCLASNGVATTPCTVNVQGTTLEQPPSQLNGGAFNSSYTSGTVTLGTPLAPGASINVRFLVGIQQTGSFKFFFNIEALP